MTKVREPRARVAKGWADKVRWARALRPPKNSEGFAAPERQYRILIGPSKAQLRGEAELLIAAYKAEQAKLIEASKRAAKLKHTRLRLPH